MTSTPATGRDLDLLPKAHLHLHFTGSLDAVTLAELAADAGIELPEHLLDTEALSVPATTRGWFRFQRSYDIARLVVASEQAMRRVVQAAAANDAREGCRRLEFQIDPTSYAPYVGGLVPALEIVLDEARRVSAAGPVEVALIVAASRRANPLDAQTLARLAAHYAGDGPGEVVGFGLSNDEHAGPSRSPGGPGCPGFRTAASWLGRSMCGGSWRRCSQPGSGMGSGPRRTRSCWTRSCPARSRWRSALLAMCTWGCTSSCPMSRCGSCSMPGSRSRSALTTRCCSSPGSATSTGSPAMSTG